MTTQNIWTSYNREVKQFILSKVKNEQISNDLLQDTFIKIHTKLYTLKTKTSLNLGCLQLLAIL